MGSAICDVTLENPLSGAPAHWRASGAVNPQPNGTVTLVANSTTGAVLSVQPDGSWQTRPAGTAGPYETAGLNGNVLTYCPDGAHIYAYLFMPTVPNV